MVLRPSDQKKRQKLTESMPKRVMQVLNSKGSYISDENLSFVKLNAIIKQDLFIECFLLP